MLESHPVAALFPLMVGKDLDELVQDVKGQGQLVPVWLHRDGSILDGRNRYLACELAGVEPQCRTWEGPDTGIVQFVMSMNIHRRHLSEERRAFIAAKMATMTARDTLRQGAAPVPATGRDGESPLISQVQAASAMRTTHAKVERAARVIRHAPELIPVVEAGDMTLSAAAKKATAKAADAATKERRRAEGLERGKRDLVLKRQAERLSLLHGGARSLRLWIARYEGVEEMKHEVRLVTEVAVLLEGRE